MKAIRFIYPVGVCLVLTYVVSLALFSHAGFPQALSVNTHMPFLCDKPVGEDGYYMLEVAWNLAAGKGAVGNDGQTVTGIQPLSALLFAVIAKIVQVWGGDKWTFVRAIIVFGGLNLIIFAFLIGKISQAINQGRENQKLVFAIGSALALFNFWLFRAFTYGLETGIYVTLLAALLLFTLVRLPSAKTADIVGIGLLAGLCGWARIDFGAIFFVFLVMALLWRLMSLKQALLSGLVALVLILPWFFWVYAESSTMMPSSGPAQSALINMASAGSRLASMAQSLLIHFTPWLYNRSFGPGPLGGWQSAFFILLLIALLWWLKSLKQVFWSALAGFVLILMFTPGLVPSSRQFSDLMKLVNALELASLVILAVLIRSKRINVVSYIGISKVYASWCLAVAILVPLYVMFFWAVHFYARYTTPLHCVILPFLAVILSALLAAVKRKEMVIHAFFVVLIASFTIFAGVILHTGVTNSPQSVSAGFIQQYFDQKVRIGAFQSGALGYFNQNTINLDGKVNSQALRALRTKTLERYIDEAHIDVIIDWPEAIHGSLNEQWLTGWQPCVRQPADKSICLIRRGAGLAFGKNGLPTTIRPSDGVKMQ